MITKGKIKLDFNQLDCLLPGKWRKLWSNWLKCYQDNKERKVQIRFQRIVFKYYQVDNELDLNITRLISIILKYYQNDDKRNVEDDNSVSVRLCSHRLINDVRRRARRKSRIWKINEFTFSNVCLSWIGD